MTLQWLSCVDIHEGVPDVPMPKECANEKSKDQQTIHSLMAMGGIGQVMQCQDYSRLLHVTAYLLKFI